MPTEPATRFRFGPPLTKSRRGLCLAGAALLAVWHFAFGATPAAVGLLPSPLDKGAHVLFFATLAFLLSAGRGGVRPGLTFAAVCLLGAADEFMQSLLPGRHAGWDDLLADALGAFAGVLAARGALAGSTHAPG
jgi:hypothetical protein